MYRYAALLAFACALAPWPQQSLAQTPAQTSQAPQVTAEAAKSTRPVVAMAEPLPGDQWSYEVRDEITGKISATRTTVITEVSPTEIATRLTVVGTGNSDPRAVLFDRSWNVIQGGPWKYSPNDGAGVSMPLTTGKTWDFRSSDFNSASGSGWKRTGSSKVVGQESLTVKAGTFETYKIETSYSSQSNKDPSRKTSVTNETWYAPAIDHWIKRTTTVRTNAHLMINNSVELVDYGRKQ